ncbi:hypothetical protein [Arthrobacter dokdonensis]|uniref:hypothetical protein n=1 Tax=Arthrobacter dokdonellae TaxID=2211210 RepID=UPI001013CAD1|nr:hypothetical protein [Arthrobacter dokdonellae]
MEEMNNRKLAAVLAAASMAGVLAMGGCAPQQSPGDTPGAQQGGPQTGSTAPATEQSTELLMLNDQLKAALGSAYSDSWIEGGRLHVAITTREAEKAVSRAGAVPKLVTFDVAQLEAALRAVAAWQASLPPAQASAIHRIISDGRNGTVTIYVDTTQLDAISGAAATDRPAGNVPLLIKESAGLPTPQ